MQQQQTSLDFNAARARADSGMARARDHVERTEPGWTETAVSAVRTYAESIYPEKFTMEQARAQIRESISPPPDLRAWGAVTVALRKQKRIEPTGTYAPVASSNGSPKPEYRACLVVT